MRTNRPELILLLGTLLAPFLPLPWAGLVLIVLTAFWLRLRPPRREVVVIAAGTVLALVGLGLRWDAERESQASNAAWARDAAHRYRDVWQNLLDEASEAAEAPEADGEGLRPLSDPPTEEEIRQAFEALQGLERGRNQGQHSLLLLDPDGAAVAWAGEGLLHDPQGEEIPRSGLAYRASYTAVTFLAIRPLEANQDARRPWRIVAGASFQTDELPFPSAAGSLRWSLVDRPDQALPDTLSIPVGGAPTLVVERRPGLAAPERAWGVRLAWAAIAFSLLALAVMRGAGRVLPAGAERAASPRERWAWVVTLALAGVFAAGMAAALSVVSLVAMLLGLAAAAWALRLADERGEAPSPTLPRADARERAPSTRPEESETASAGETGDGGANPSRDGGTNPSPGSGALRDHSKAVGGGALSRGAGEGRGGGFFSSSLAAGAVASLLLFVLSWALQLWRGPLDLGGAILVEPEAFALRLAFAGAALGLFLLAGRRGGPPLPVRVTSERWGWLAAFFVLTGAAVCDQPAAALPLLAAGGAAMAHFTCRRPLREGLTLMALVVLAALSAAACWETAYRLRLRAHARTELITGLAPLTLKETRALNAEIQDRLQGRDLGELVPRSLQGLGRQDLAYALWRTSPLARADARSALSVLPLGVGESNALTFSSGMPLTDDGGIDSSQSNWLGPPVTGRTDLSFAGRPWGRVEYSLLPRPGFQSELPRWTGESETDLLLGLESADPLEAREAPAVYALYGADRRAIFSPWEETPSLPRELRAGGPGVRSSVVRTPDRRFARAYVQGSAESGGWQVVYLPYLTPLAALERAANSALGILLLLAFIAPPALLLALPRAAFRDALWRTVRSYSRRLVLVYTVLLLLPLLLLNAVLVRSMEERLRREQQTAGEAALDSARQILGDLLLKSPPGFGIDAVFGDQLMSQLSNTIHHEINLYYGNSYYSSSRHELFTAGLLPRRIPGEIYSRLALEGYGLASRTNRVGGKTYLELYTPLRVPGMPIGEERLFLSLPMFAQQEQAARQLAQLRRQALLVTATLFVLLVAVGARLARNFTRPIMQLVEGTRRIAAGAPSLDLAPTELELAALVEAVDEMARRIAEGRERLLREKQVVERMVENITSGVVSLDRERRVLMHNRVAAELLGVQVGESLEEVAARSGRLAPVAAFLESVPAETVEMARGTVRLLGDSGGEREWALVWVPVPGAGEPAALLVVEDATEVLRSQRLQAWAEMARIIAHEIKNPLTPIRLSAEHMREVYQNDPDHFGRVFDRCTSNILTQVEELRSIASEFSAYSAIPRIDPQPGDLTAAMAELVEGYRAAPPEGVSVELETDGAIRTRFDAKLLGRAVRNLLENALRATRPAGGRVVVRVEPVSDRNGGHARIAVVDSGPGVRPDLLPRIFDPYFSTHDTGTGLGLAIARRIAEEHGGGITARNRPEGGLEVVVTVPITEERV